MSEYDATLDDFSEKQGHEDQQDDDLRLPEIDEISNDWGLVTVENIAEDLIGGGTPSKSNEEFWGGTIPWASVKDLGDIELTEPEDYITEAGVENSATNVAPAGSVVISTRMTVGEPFLNTVEMAINQDMKAIIPDSDQINPVFLVYSLWDKDPYLKSLGRGTTVDGITTQNLSRTHLGLPSLEEQRNIASILYNVDRAVRKTDEIVEQYRRLYSGLLQSVFREHEGEQTQEAGRLGEIPSSWDVVSLSDVADVTMGNSPKSKYYNSKGEGLPFYQGADEFGERSPTPDRWCSDPKKTGNPGDTLLNIRSHTNVGKVNQATHKCCIGRGLAAITPGPEIDGDFLYHHLRERENYVNAIASGSTFDSVNSKEVESLKVALPPMDVQEQIASALDDVQDAMLKEKELSKQFSQVKHGLLRDLLSGAVRTTDTNIEVLDEVAQYG